MKYKFESAKRLIKTGTVTLWNRYGTQEYLLSHKEPTDERVWIPMSNYPTFKNKGYAVRYYGYGVKCWSE